MTVSLPVGADTIPGTAFGERVAASTGRPLRAAGVRTVQANIGLRCNLACRHCHVESSPKRTEEMSWPTMQRVLDVSRRSGAGTLDITGGAPEMHPHFRRFVEGARALGLHVMVRSNLTILREAGHTSLPTFFRDHRVHLVASLPCYLESNVDRQRGRGVYAESIDAIRTLNALGYGTDPALSLDLVFNPGGPSLPPPQVALEAAYRNELHARFGIRFTRLVTITNMPIGRFLDDLRRHGRADDYMTKLRDAYNPATVDGLMCRHQLHVAWDGTMYDCDFNFALRLPVSGETPRNIHDLDLRSFAARAVATGEHCFGCTAGAGSSCGGALA
jgi:radical SAM/Cys-rich protein